VSATRRASRADITPGAAQLALVVDDGLQNQKRAVLRLRRVEATEGPVQGQKAQAGTGRSEEAVDVSRGSVLLQGTLSALRGLQGAHINRSIQRLRRQVQ